MKIGLRWRWILPLVVLIVFYPASAQDAVVQTPYTCPTETEFRSETPFTQAQVEDWLGFWHPLLQAVVDLPEPNGGSPYTFLTSCTFNRDGVYVSVVLQTGQVLAFSLNSFQVIAGDSYPLSSVGWAFISKVSKFADRNFNGLPDWFVQGGDTGLQDYVERIRLLEWGNDGNIYEVSLPAIEDAIEDVPVQFDDIDRDGIAEVVDILFFFIPMRGYYRSDVRGAVAWFGLQGSSYEMVAVQVPAFPAESYHNPPQDSRQIIDEFLSNIQFDSLCESLPTNIAPLREYSFNERLFEILLYYQLWGETEEGWAAIQPIWDAVADCPESEQKQFFFESIAEYGEYIAMRDSE